MAQTEEEFLRSLGPTERAAYERMMFGGRVKDALPAPMQPTAPVQQQSQPDIPKIKRNIGRMIDQGAPEHEVDAYVQSEGVTPEQLRAHAQQPQDLSWSQVPGKALENVGPSAVRTAEAVAHPFLHPIDTAKALGNVAYGIGSKAAGAIGIEQDPQKKAENEAQLDAVGQFFKSRYGSVESLKKTLAEDPVGVAADLATVLYGGGGTVARAGGTVGKVGEAISKAGSVVDPLANAGRVAKGLGKATSEGLGLTTGVSGSAIETAFNAGRQGSTAFTDNMRGKVPVTNTLDIAKDAVGKMRDQRREAYTDGMAGVEANAGFKKMDLRPIAKDIESAARMVHFGKFAKSAEAADTLKAISSKFEEFVQLDDPIKLTAKGLDALKQAMGEIRAGTKPGTLSRTIADRVYNSVKSQIVKQVPEYAKVMKGYSDASDTLDDLTKTFSLGETAAKDTAVRKLTSAMRNNVNTNYGRREQLLNELAKSEPELPNAIAGISLNSLAPRGLSRLSAGTVAAGGAMMSNPMAIPMLAASSPRLVGEGAYALGRGAGGAEAALNALYLDPAAMAQGLRASYAVNALSQPGYVLRGSQTDDYPSR